MIEVNEQSNDQNSIVINNKNPKLNSNPTDIDFSNTILEIEVLNSSTIANGTKIKINKDGLISGSLRNKKDQITYFGYSDDNVNNTINENNSLDYALPKRHNEKIGRYFKIEFKKESNEFYIKDLGNNNIGTFIKIDNIICLRDNTMINIGDSYLVCYFGDTFEETEPESIKVELVNGKNLHGRGYKLKVKLFDKNNLNEQKEFIFDKNQKIVHIGRKKHGNQIELDDNLASKINTTIEYDSRIGWTLKDGDEIIKENGDKKRIFSTNGTWILAVDNTKIYEGLIFKINFNLFRCSFTKI